MEFLQLLLDEVLGFFGISKALEIPRSGDFSALRTYEGVTGEEEQRQIPVEYEITRPIDSGNFLDVYFGEFVALGKDVARPRDSSTS